MAYSCALHLKEECDGCGACEEEIPSGKICAVCRRMICCGEEYYDIAGEAVCGECVIDYVRRYARAAEKED